MSVLEQNPPPRTEATALLELVSKGLETPRSVREMIRIRPREARFLDRQDILYRAEIRREFDALLSPTPTVEQAIAEALAELMPAPVQNLHTPEPPCLLRKQRRPYRSHRRPVNDEALASRTLAAVAHSFGVRVADLMSNRRGASRGGLPRAACALLLRSRGFLMREVVDLLGYADAAGPYAALHALARARARDPILDRDVSALLESTGTDHQGPPRNTQALAHSPALLHERQDTDRMYPEANCTHP